LNPTRTRHTQLKNPISTLLALQETLSRSDLHKHLYTRMNKGRKTPERGCKKLKSNNPDCSIPVTTPPPPRSRHTRIKHS